LEFVAHIFPKLKDSPVATVIDVVLFAVFGSLFATTFTQPESAQQALAAGLGWTGLLTAAVRKGEEKAS